VLDSEAQVFVLADTVSTTGVVDPVTSNKRLYLDKHIEFVGLYSIDALPLYGLSTGGFLVPLMSV
jgi:hypothetical protein